MHVPSHPSKQQYFWCPPELMGVALEPGTDEKSAGNRTREDAGPTSVKPERVVIGSVNKKAIFNFTNPVSILLESYFCSANS